MLEMNVIFTSVPAESLEPSKFQTSMQCLHRLKRLSYWPVRDFRHNDVPHLHTIIRSAWTGFFAPSPRKALAVTFAAQLSTCYKLLRVTSLIADEPLSCACYSCRWLHSSILRLQFGCCRHILLRHASPVSCPVCSSPELRKRHTCAGPRFHGACRQDAAAPRERGRRKCLSIGEMLEQWARSSLPG